MHCNPGKLSKNLTILIISYIFIFFFGMLNIPSGLYGADTVRDTSSIDFDGEYIKELVKKIKEADVAVKFARKAVRNVPDSSLLPQLLFQLSELEIRREKLHFELNSMKYDIKLRLFEKGKLKSEPPEPELTFENTLKINRKILNNYPDVPFRDQLLYRNAICYYETGKKDSAKIIFLRLIPKCQEDTLKAELIFRLGECYFDEGNFEKALITYQQILESWSSPFFAMALYKIGWCHYRMDNITDAISTFCYLLKDIHLIENIDSEIIGKSQIELRSEVIQYIAFSFSDFGGLSPLLDFIKQMGIVDDKPELLFRLGDIYFQRDFFEEAIKTFDLVIKECVNYEKLPEIFSKKYLCFEKMGKRKQAFAVREEFIKKCGEGSKWAMTNNTEESNAVFRATLEQLDARIATPFLESADSLFANQRYRGAAKQYVRFMKNFPKDKRADHAQYCLGECLFQLKLYSKAAEAYKQVVEKFPESELVEDAAYNQIVCFDQILGQKSDAAQDTSQDIENNPPLQDLIRSCHSFLKTVPKSDRVPEIKLKLAEVFYQHKLYTLSEKYAYSALTTILKTKKGEQHKLNAINLLARLSFKLEKYNKAQKLYTLLMNEQSDSTALVQKYQKMVASSLFKIGEQLKSRGKVTQAAIRFERTALRATDPKIAATALFEAGLQYEKANKFVKAVINFESIFRKYPDSEQAKESIYRAAVLREKLEQYHLAAKDFYDLYRLLGPNSEGASALFNAGLAFEKAGDWIAVINTFNEYVTQFSGEYDQVLEAMFKIAFAYEKQNLTNKANLSYQTVINKYKQLIQLGEIADEYYAAEATFRMAEIRNNGFRSIDLKPPFQFNLKRKKQAFNEMLKVYVAVTQYDIAEWTTAAFYRIGLAYEQFCQDILNSPPPANLSEDQLQSYWQTIEQQLVIPLQKEALKYYETNLQLALQNSVTNEWTGKTEDQLVLLRRNLAQKNALPKSQQFKRAGGQVRLMSNKRRTL